MKQQLFVAINSKFVHSNLGVWYLHAQTQNAGIDSGVMSFTIHDPKDKILRSILSKNPKLVCFSCYIWNIQIVESLCRDIKKIDDNIRILLGGPEVSFKAQEILKKTNADCVLIGEGEVSIVNASKTLLENKIPSGHGIACLKDQVFEEGGYGVVENLDTIVSPYTNEMTHAEKDRILYFETSRGCVFQCIYCLSSCMAGIRWFSFDRVIKELDFLLDQKPKQIKFVDRTFNHDKERMKKMIGFIQSKETETNFHMEIHPTLLDDELIDLLNQTPPGRIQIEAGIQSVHEKTLKASGRYQDSEKALSNVKKIIEGGTIHVHLDLIAGLPFSDIQAFKESFDQTLQVDPHVLQLGFLKILHGTKIHGQKEYVWSDDPPYEILKTKWLSHEALMEIKKVEVAFDMFYNSKRFVRTLSYLINQPSPYDFYKELGEWMFEKGYGDVPLSAAEQFKVLYDFGDQEKALKECLRFDHMASFYTKALPPFLKDEKDKRAKELLFSYLKKHHEKLAQRRFSVLITIEDDCEKQYLFDYQKRNPVTHRFHPTFLNDALCFYAKD